jgi:hypothetical protein
MKNVFFELACALVCGIMGAIAGLFLGRDLALAVFEPTPDLLLLALLGSLLMMVMGVVTGLWFAERVWKR